MYIGYSQKAFDLYNRGDLFRFIFRLYGFLHLMRSRTAELSKDFTQIYSSLQSLTDMMPCLNTQKSARGSSGRQSGSRTTTTQTFRSLDVASRAHIAAKGYELLSVCKQDVPENIAKAEKDGRVVALKLVHTRERDILRNIPARTDGTRDSHVVELIDVISFSAIHDIIVMPWLSPLENCFADLKTDRSVKLSASLMTQFLEGVSFLHKHYIAHLDLKPENVLVRHTDGIPVPQLSIIDFGISIRVQDEETLVTGFRGTPSWTAPEVGRREGPTLTYSAIRADRWSCGRMLEHFCPNNSLFRDMCKKLLDPKPSRRPSLDNTLKMLQPESSRRSRKRNIDTDGPRVLTNKRAVAAILGAEFL